MDITSLYKKAGSAAAPFTPGAAIEFGLGTSWEVKMMLLKEGGWS